VYTSTVTSTATLNPVASLASVVAPPDTATSGEPVRPQPGLLLTDPPTEVVLTEPTDASAALPPAAPSTSGLAPSHASTAAAAVNTRRQMRDADISYAVRLATSESAEVVTDSLLAAFRTDCTREQLLRIVRLMFGLLRDVGVFLRERITVARLTNLSSDDLLDELSQLIERFVGGARR